MSGAPAPGRRLCCGTASLSTPSPGVGLPDDLARTTTVYRHRRPVARQERAGHPRLHLRRVCGRRRAGAGPPGPRPSRSTGWATPGAATSASGSRTARPDAHVDHHRHARHRRSAAGEAGPRRWPLVQMYRLDRSERTSCSNSCPTALRRPRIRCRPPDQAANSHGVIPRCAIATACFTPCGR